MRADDLGVDLQAILDSIGDGLALIDPLGKVLYLNPAAEAMFRISASSAVGHSVVHLISARDAAEIGEILSAGAGRHLREVDALRPDGTEFLMELTVTRLETASGTIFVVAGRDVSERREAEAELRRSVEGRRDFISMVSHEFRTALTGIQGFSEMMRDQDFTVRELKEFAGDIHKDAVRLNRMISDLVELDRMEAGRDSVDLTSLGFNSIVAQVLNEARGREPAARFHVVLGEPEVMVLADQAKLAQAVENLLLNAVKYSPPGAPISVSTGVAPEHVTLSVGDEGVPIPSDELETVFQRYGRAQLNATRHVGASGLGLPIVQRIAELHGGSAWAESAQRGATFHLRIPRGGPQ